MALPDEEMARQSEGCLSARAERERGREQNTLHFFAECSSHLDPLQKKTII
jgi:hypothetical protein